MMNRPLPPRAPARPIPHPRTQLLIRIVAAAPKLVHRLLEHGHAVEVPHVHVQPGPEELQVGRQLACLVLDDRVPFPALEPHLAVLPRLGAAVLLQPEAVPAEGHEAGAEVVEVGVVLAFELVILRFGKSGALGDVHGLGGGGVSELDDGFVDLDGDVGAVFEDNCVGNPFGSGEGRGC